MGRKKKYTDKVIRNIYSGKEYLVLSENDNLIKVQNAIKEYFVMTKSDVEIVEKGKENK